MDKVILPSHCSCSRNFFLISFCLLIEKKICMGEDVVIWRRSSVLISVIVIIDMMGINGFNIVI